MDFSEPYKYSGPAPAYSPDGRYLAAAVEYRLIIRDAESLQVVQLYSCLDRIDHLEWSRNSMYVLCAQCSRAIIQVWSAEQSDWTCKIDEGPAGVQAARWAPDGTAVLVSAVAGIRTTVWSLSSRRCHYLPGAKACDGAAAAFSPDGRVMVQLERVECRDQLAVYDTQTWAQVTRFDSATTDAAGVSWSPDGGCLAVTDSPLYYKVALYTPAGKQLTVYQAYSDALGVRTAAWDPSGQFLAVGSYDQKVRVLSDVTWQPLLTGDHPPRVSEPPGTVVLYQEEVEGFGAVSSSHTRSETKSRYAIRDAPVDVPVVPPAPADRLPQSPKPGVSVLRWSPCGRFLATVNATQPTAVWLWDLAAGGLTAVLLQSSEVKDAQWAPQGAAAAAAAGGGAGAAGGAGQGGEPGPVLLAVVTGGPKVFLWSAAGASVVHVPLRGFAAEGLDWAPHGTSFVLRGRDSTFCCAYMVAPA